MEIQVFPSHPLRKNLSILAQQKSRSSGGEIANIKQFQRHG